MAAGSVLVVDDEPDLRDVYELALVREGYDVDTASGVNDARDLLMTKEYQVVITDMRMPDGLGIELVKLISENNRSEKCLVVTAYGSAENAVEALKAGAFDYLTKPVNLKQLRQIVATAMQLEGDNAAPVANTVQAPAGAVNPVAANEATRRLLGHSEVMQQVRHIIAKVAPTMAPVLVFGESGTGKELVAHAIHQSSHRAHGPFIAVNCGAIPENLMEAEFFGYRKGAFTGANENRVGLFASAAGGTLFLDEIGELPLAMQSKLLRVIQERAVRAVGSNHEETVDVRIISATHRNLAEDVKKGRFRQDLFYRLNVIEVVVPPLRQRQGDTEEIAHHILRKIGQESALPAVPQFSPEALKALMQYNFPGNVRELENILHRAVALSNGQVIMPQDLSLTMPQADAATQAVSSPAPQADVQAPSTGGGSGGVDQNAAAQQDAFQVPSMQPNIASDGSLPSDLSAYMDQIERKMLVRALEMHHFNRTAAAAQLGLTLRQIRYRMDRLGIDVPEGKDR